MASAVQEIPVVCPDCGTGIAASSLSCANCGRLTHAAELEDLAQKARAATLNRDLPTARDLWRRALDLLPEGTLQYRSVQAKLSELEEQIKTSPSGGWKKGLVGLGPLALLLGKGKLLLLGLTKLSTLLSMFAFFGVYWALYGWAFALGLVLTIYVHEMGHVLTLRSYGMAASAPMFIPGLGAYIRLRTAWTHPSQESRVGLAGPLYGLGAALLAYGVYAVTGAKTWGAIAHATAVMNLFNLIPIWQLDGARGLASLTRGQRGVLLGAAVCMWAITSQPMLFLIAAGLAFRMFTKDAPAEGDHTGLMQYAGLLVALPAVAVFAHVG